MRILNVERDSSSDQTEIRHTCMKPHMDVQTTMCSKHFLTYITFEPFYTRMCPHMGSKGTSHGKRSTKRRVLWHTSSIIYKYPTVHNLLNKIEHIRIEWLFSFLITVTSIMYHVTLITSDLKKSMNEQLHIERAIALHPDYSYSFLKFWVTQSTVPVTLFTLVGFLMSMGPNVSH